MSGDFSLRLARQISNWMIPPTFLLLVTTVLVEFVPGSLGQKLLWWSVSVGGAGILPTVAIFGMFYRGQVSGKHLPLREERTVPYLVSILFTALTSGLLGLLDTPAIFVAMMLVYLGNTVFLLMVNFWWKMSAHLMGATGPLTILLWKAGFWALPLFLLPLAVAWARIRLKVHTPAQVVAGGLSGILLTYLQLAFWMRILN